jgi:putative nucleotidyltransferase with HDIG domain
MTASNSFDSSLQRAQCAELDGAWDDALAGYQITLAEARAAGDRRAEAQVLRTIGRVFMERGDYDRARASFEECLHVAQADDQPALAASALNAMAAVAQMRGQVDVAESLYARSSVLAAETGDARLCAIIDQNLGTLANIRGDLKGALVRYRSALERFRQIPDERAAGVVLNNMGMLHTDLGEWAAAELSFNSAFVISERLADLANVAKVEANRAELYLKRQNYERAREHCDNAFRIFGRIASDIGLANVHKFYGMLSRETGKPQLAHIQLGLALRLSRSCDNKLTEAETESERARVFLSQHNFRPALKSLNRANELFRELDARREILDVTRRLNSLEDPYRMALELWAEDEPVLQAERTTARGARVSDLAARLLRALGEEAQVPTVRLGAFLHDVGMSAVPEGILRKTGALTSDERHEVQQHTLKGEELVRELQFPESVMPIVRNHHERWDGCGYPDRLGGEQIPLAARVVCIADVFDALTSDRPFRPAHSTTAALDLMAEDAGRIFDPAMFGTFRDLVGTAAGPGVDFSSPVV